MTANRAQRHTSHGDEPGGRAQLLGADVAQLLGADVAQLLDGDLLAASSAVAVMALLSSW